MKTNKRLEASLREPFTLIFVGTEIKPKWISRLQNVLEQTLPIVHRISLVNNQFRIAAMMQILTPCLLVNSHRRFEGVSFFYLQSERVQEGFIVILKCVSCAI